MGSEGMLGVVTEATLRLIPKPASRAMLGAAIFPEFAMATAAVQAILDAGHLPSGLEITDTFTLEAARRRLGADRFCHQAPSLLGSGGSSSRWRPCVGTPLVSAA